MASRWVVALEDTQPASGHSMGVMWRCQVWDPRGHLNNRRREATARGSKSQADGESCLPPRPIPGYVVFTSRVGSPHPHQLGCLHEVSYQ